MGALAPLFPDGANPAPPIRLSHLLPASNDLGLKSVKRPAFPTAKRPMQGYPRVRRQHHEKGRPMASLLLLAARLAGQKQPVGGVIAHLFPAVANLVQVVVEGGHVLVRQLEGAEHPAVVSTVVAVVE